MLLEVTSQIEGYKDKLKHLDETVVMAQKQPFMSQND